MTHGIHSPMTSSMSAHMENVPDMAIFTPVQTTTIAASPRHRVLPAFKDDRPVRGHDVVHDLIQIPFEVVLIFGGMLVGTEGSICCCARAGAAHRSSAARAQPAARMSGRIAPLREAGVRCSGRSRWSLVTSLSHALTG